MPQMDHPESLAETLLELRRRKCLVVPEEQLDINTITFLYNKLFDWAQIFVLDLKDVI